MGRREGQPWDGSEGLRPVRGAGMDRAKAGACGLVVNREGVERRARGKE